MDPWHDHAQLMLDSDLFFSERKQNNLYSYTSSVVALLLEPVDGESCFILASRLLLPGTPASPKSDPPMCRN